MTLTMSVQKIKNIFTLEKPNFPANVVGSHRLLCPNSGVWVNNALQCDVVKTSDEVSAILNPSSVRHSVRNTKLGSHYNE